MPRVVPPSPAEVDSYGLRAWHQVYKTPWEVLVGIGYVEGAAPVLNAQNVPLLAPGDGEVAIDASLSTIAEKELADAGELLYAVSTDAGDTTDATMSGVNADGVHESVSFTLNGLTPVQVVSSATSIAGAWTTGHCLRNTATSWVGTVYVSTLSTAGIPATATDSIQIVVPTDDNRGENPLIEAGDSQVLVFGGFNISVSVKDQITVHMHIKPEGSPWQLAFSFLAYQNAFSYRPTIPVVMAQGSKMIATAAASSSGTAISFQMSYYALDALDLSHAEGVGMLFR